MFRIRNPYEVSGEKEAVYSRHLEEHKSKIPAPLWHHFRTGFFHDGTISKIEIPSFEKIVVQITCPNIVLKNNAQNKFINVEFRCIFDGVTEFSVKIPEGQEGESIQESDSKLQYLYSEIDSIEQSSTGDDYHSVIIQTAPIGQFITIVFSSCRVEAVEPVAFALMQSNPAFILP